MTDTMDLGEPIAEPGQVGDASSATTTSAASLPAETAEETSFETIQRLAVLSTLEYERCRKDEAKRLNMRASVLDKEVNSARPRDDAGNDLGLIEPEPWPEEIDGAGLLDRMVGGLCRHVVMPSHVAEAVALWCLHAYAFEAWQHTPRLAIGAPEKGCGRPAAPGPDNARWPVQSQGGRVAALNRHCRRGRRRLAGTDSASGHQS